MKKSVLAIMLILLLVAGGAVWLLRPVPPKSPETAFRLPENAQITHLVVEKSQRKMYAYNGDKLLKTYDFAARFTMHPLKFAPKGCLKML